jgi:hypothetical protein
LSFMHSSPFRNHRVIGVAVLALGLMLGHSEEARAGERTLFVRSAIENADGTVTLPLYRGTSRGRLVWFVILDTSNGQHADLLGVNRAQKLVHVRGTLAVQRVNVQNGIIEFPATVDFRPERRVVPGPLGFPPLVAEPGAVGEAGYSPLIELPDGTILNAPHVANDSGQADKVMDLDVVNGRVRYLETEGFQGDRVVRYVSTDASDPAVAAVEDVTFAPLLNHAPFTGGDGTNSSRASLAAFVNGQTDASNPERQGLNSALLDGLDPLNVLFWSPNQGRYSPLWDVHPAAWSAFAIATGRNLRQTDFGDVLNLAQQGIITGPGGTPFGSAGFVVNCPIVSRE